MKPNRLAQGILKRVCEASLPPGAAAANALLESHLRRLAGTIGDGLPDSAAGWMAIVEFGTDRASVEARSQVAQKTHDVSYNRYLQALALIDKARQRKEAGVKPNK